MALGDIGGPFVKLINTKRTFGVYQVSFCSPSVHALDCIGLGCCRKMNGCRVVVETLGEALNHGWRVHMRCLDDGMRGLKHMRECGFKTDLDLRTLVCTRGR